MSSAQNHRARSHRSSVGNRATFGNIQRNTAIRNVRVEQARSFRQRLEAMFSRIRKPKEAKTDKT